MITNFKIYEKERISNFKKYIIFKFEDINIIILFEVFHKWGNNHKVKQLYRIDDIGFRESIRKPSSLTYSSNKRWNSFRI